MHVPINEKNRFSRQKNEDRDAADERRKKLIQLIKKKQVNRQTSASKAKQAADTAQESDNDKESGYTLKRERQLKRENEKLTQKIDQFQSQHLVDGKTIKQLQKEIKQSRDNDERLSTSNARLTERLTQLTVKQRDHYSETQHLKNLLDKQDRHVNALTQFNKNLERQNHQLREQLQLDNVSRLEASNHDLKARNHDLAKTNSELTNALNKIRKELNAANQHTQRVRANEIAKAIHATPISQLTSDLLDRLNEKTAPQYLDLMILFQSLDSLLKRMAQQSELYAPETDLLTATTEFYGYLHIQNEGDQDEFISLDGSVFPDPIFRNHRIKHVDNDVYRGYYSTDLDQFVITRHYPMQNMQASFANRLAAVKRKRPSERSKDAFVNQFVDRYPDARDILLDKNIKVVTWFKQVSYKRLFEQFGVNIEILDPSERSGDLIFNRLEDVDTDMAFVLQEGSHHVNSTIYKDRPSGHPDRIKLLKNASPKTLLEMTYQHFKALKTRRPGSQEEGQTKA